MLNKITHEGKIFTVIPDVDNDYIIYVLDDFHSGKTINFKIDIPKVYFYLELSTVILPNHLFGYGFKSNFLEFSNLPVSGAVINSFKSEIQALNACLVYIKKSFIHNQLYGKQLIEKLEQYINPQSLFEIINE